LKVLMSHVRSNTRQLLRKNERIWKLTQNAVKLTNKKNSPKLTIMAEPTNVCNFRCEHCFNPIMTRPKGFMALNDFEKYVINQNLSHLSRVSFTGWGEPLLHPDIIRMINYAEEKGVRTTMPTNASLLTKDNIERILNSRLDEIRFSIDGFDKSYEAVRKHEYSKIYENVMQFLSCRKKCGSHIDVTLVCVVNDVTAPLIREWETYWHQYGHTEFQRAAQFNGARTQPCTIIGSTWYAWHNLDVSPCCLDYDGKIILGNLRTSNIDEIINSENFMELKAANQAKVWPTRCKSCTEWEGEIEIPLAHRFSMQK
jgi:MoaA/NifB/PqqE/SkfB family radical SAM enzyme